MTSLYHSDFGVKSSDSVLRFLCFWFEADPWLVQDFVLHLIVIQVIDQARWNSGYIYKPMPRSRGGYSDSI